MTSNLFILLASALVLQACSSSSSSSGSAPAQAVGTTRSATSPTAPPSAPPTPAEAEKTCRETPIRQGYDARYAFSETVNGVTCSTGCQIFNSWDEYCSGVLNDDLNYNCAHEARVEDYQANCVSSDDSGW